METYTMQQRIENLLKTNANANWNELYSKVDAIIYEEIFDGLDSTLYSVTKRWKNYGTWQVTLWVNSYWFGEKVAEILNEIKITTHDEDKKFTIEDFADEITERITDWAFEYWGDELWNEED